MNENPVREFVLFVAGACERAITVLRDNGFTFERFPRDMVTNPPMNEGERWEALAFSLYSDLAELASKADQILETDVIYSQEQQLIEEREACEWVRAELRGTRQRLEDVNVKDSVKTREINILTKENRELRAALESLVRKTEECDNPRDEGVSEHDDVMRQARAALGVK